MRNLQDPLWEHFHPLWSDLSCLGAKKLLVAGGYGIFLKHRWMIENPDVRTIVPVSRWQDDAPRVTKDLDLVIGVEVIADEVAQRQIVSALNKNAFEVTERNPRWQFSKKVSKDLAVIVELHSPLPTPSQIGVDTDKIRVKHKPSLGADGVHGRQNPEAVGCELGPTELRIEGFPIWLPNPITWSIMKLKAAQDRWDRCNDPTENDESRSFSRAQAIKHAQDVCKVVALVTLAEGDATPAVIASLQSVPQFRMAADIVANSFTASEHWIPQVVAEKWSDQDFTTVQQVLASWFRMSGPVH